MKILFSITVMANFFCKPWTFRQLHKSRAYIKHKKLKKKMKYLLTF